MIYLPGDVIRLDHIYNADTWRFGIVVEHNEINGYNTDSVKVSFDGKSHVSIPSHTITKIGTAQVPQGTVLAIPRFKGQSGYLLELSQEGFNPSRILDIGANVGRFAAHCHSIWPAAHVTSIEANPNCAESLKATADEIHIALLSDGYCSERKFYMQADDPVSQGNSYYRDRMPWFTNALSTTLEATTLAALLAGQPPYQLVKLDTQGSELDIIQGGREIIRAAEVVICEVAGPEPYNAGAPPRKRVEQELHALGFTEQLDLEWWYDRETGNIVNTDVSFRRAR